MGKLGELPDPQHCVVPYPGTKLFCGIQAPKDKMMGARNNQERREGSKGFPSEEFTEPSKQERSVPRFVLLPVHDKSSQGSLSQCRAVGWDSWKSAVCRG